MESQVEGTLQEWISAPRADGEEPYLCVAQLLAERGVVSLLSEAWPVFNSSPNKPAFHPTRFIEKLLRVLPVMAFSSSRKEGWLLSARGDDVYNALSATYRLVQKLEQRDLRAGSLTRKEITDLEDVMEPSEKVFMSYILCRIFGIEETARRFGYGKDNLKKVVEKVTAILEATTSDEVSSVKSPKKKRKVARKPLINKARGGRKPWEIKAPDVAMLLVDMVRQAGAKIHPSLNDPTLHLAGTGTKIRDLKARLDDLVRAEEIELSPSPSAISRAMTRRGGRGNVAISAKATKKVLGEKHVDLPMLSALHQNLRSFYLQHEAGHVALLAYDDLEKMPLDQLAYNGKKVQVVGNGEGMLAPSSNYSNGRKLIFTSWLVLTLETKANRDRLQNKRAALRRFNASPDSLPLAVQQALSALGEGGRSLAAIPEIEIKITDRSGHAFVVIKGYGKEKDEQRPWSQPSTALQHSDDLLLVLSKLKSHSPQAALRTHLFSREDPDEVVPWLILTSDGASDQSVCFLQNVLPLWELLVLLDLDGIEKIHYCPNHSKMDPAEMVNHTTKQQFRGRYLASGNGTEREMEQAKHAAAEQLADVTHAGEKLHAFVQPCRPPAEQPQVPINGYDVLMEYVHERARIMPKGKNWMHWDPPADVVAQWTLDEEKFEFAELEEKTQAMKEHIRYHANYGVIISKCLPGGDVCDFCQTHSWRGHDWYSHRIAAENRVCPRGGCQESPCDHKLNQKYSELLQEMEAKTPEDFRTRKRCGICRVEGHDRRTCPKNKEK